VYAYKAVKLKDIVTSHFVSTYGEACITVWEVEKNIWEVKTNDKKANGRGETERIIQHTREATTLFYV